MMRCIGKVLSEHSITCRLELVLELAVSSLIALVSDSLLHFFTHTSLTLPERIDRRLTIAVTHAVLNLPLPQSKHNLPKSSLVPKIHQTNVPNQLTEPTHHQPANHGLHGLLSLLSLGMEALHQNHPPHRLPSHLPHQPLQLRRRKSRPRNRRRQRSRQAHRRSLQSSRRRSHHHHRPP
jgi:hypothetical protein